MKITHQSMSKFQQSESESTSPGTKVHTVGAPDEDDAIFEQQMAQMEQEMASKSTAGGDSMPDAPPEDPMLKKEVDKKLAFEKLMFLSKDQFKDVEYGGLTFKFKVLKSSDNAKILELLQESNMTEAYQASVLGLAASLVSVNGIAFEDFYTGSEPIKNIMLKKYSELSKWPAFMVTALMAFSGSVQRDVEKEFGRSFLKS